MSNSSDEESPEPTGPSSRDEALRSVHDAALKFLDTLPGYAFGKKLIGEMDEHDRSYGMRKSEYDNAVKANERPQMSPMFYLRLFKNWVAEMDPKPSFGISFGLSLDQTHSRTETTVSMLRVFFLTGIYRTLDVLDDRVKLVLFPLDTDDDAQERRKRDKYADDMTGYELQADELRDTLLRYIQMLRKEVLLTTAVEEYEGAQRISTDDVANMLMRRTKALIRTVQMHLHAIPEGVVFVAAQHAAHMPDDKGDKPWPTGASLSLKPMLDGIEDVEWHTTASEIARELDAKHTTLKAQFDVKGTHIPDETRAGYAEYDDKYQYIKSSVKKTKHHKKEFDIADHIFNSRGK